MKHSFANALLVTALLLAGCQTATQTTQTDTTVNKPGKTKETTDTTLYTAFENAGYTISNEEFETFEHSWDIENDNGRAEIDEVSCESAETALKYYEEQCRDEGDEDFYSTDAKDTEDLKYTVFYNTINDLYNIVILDSKTDTIYTITDIPSPMLDGIQNVLASTGLMK